MHIIYMHLNLYLDIHLLTGTAFWVRPAHFRFQAL